MTTVVKTEGQHKGEFLVSEGNDSISREVGTLTSGQVVKDGQGLKLVANKLVAATGAHDTAGDSTEDFVGFAYGDYDASAADLPGVLYIARMAEVKDALITRHNTTGGGAAAATTAINGAMAKLFLVAR